MTTTPTRCGDCHSTRVGRSTPDTVVLCPLHAADQELLAALRLLFDIIENEIGYRLDSEIEHERDYARAMIDARALLARIEGA